MGQAQAGTARSRTACLAGAAAVLVLLAASPAAAKCERTNYRAVPPDNTRSEVQMTASSGKDCVLRLSATRRVTVTGRKIVAPPSRGKATIEGETVFYRSFPGYTGPDSFTAEIAGRASDGEGVATVTVQVTVTD
ncbi:MAG: hypothetical protein U1E62_24785 [Alsobacter sp.]